MVLKVRHKSVTSFALQYSRFFAKSRSRAHNWGMGKPCKEGPKRTHQIRIINNSPRMIKSSTKFYQKISVRHRVCWFCLAASSETRSRTAAREGTSRIQTSRLPSRGNNTFRESPPERDSKRERVLITVSQIIAVTTQYPGPAERKEKYPQKKNTRDQPNASIVGCNAQGTNRLSESCVSRKSPKEGEKAFRLNSSKNSLNNPPPSMPLSLSPPSVMNSIFRSARKESLSILRKAENLKLVFRSIIFLHFS